MDSCNGCQYAINGKENRSNGECMGCYRWDSDIHVLRTNYKPIKPLSNESPSFIKEVTMQDTGGGCIVDFIHLKNGKILGITDECIVLYNSMKHFEEGWDGREKVINL